jgi:hypothetical protein
MFFFLFHHRVFHGQPEHQRNRVFHLSLRDKHRGKKKLKIKN